MDDPGKSVVSCIEWQLFLEDQVRDHVGVEQVTHYKSTGLGTGSAFDGKSPFRDDKLARTASSDLGGETSMIRPSPSLLMIGSSPGIQIDAECGKDPIFPVRTPVPANSLVIDADGRSRIH